MKTLTLAEAEILSSCWDREQLLAASGGREEMTLTEILDLDHVRAYDRMFLVLSALDPHTIARLACDFAERALPIYKKRYPEDPRPRRAIEVARDFSRARAVSAYLAAAVFISARSGASTAMLEAARSENYASEDAAAAAVSAANAALKEEYCASDARDAADYASRATAFTDGSSIADVEKRRDEIRWQLEHVKQTLKEEDR